MPPWKLAWLSIRRNILMSCLLLFAMSLALGTISLMYRMDSIQKQRWEQMAHWAPLVVGPKQGAVPLILSTGLLEFNELNLIPFRLFETIRAKKNIVFENPTQGMTNENSTSQVDLAVPLLVVGSIDKHFIVGSDRSFLEMLETHSTGRLQDGIWFQNEKEVVLGSKMAKNLKKSIGDTIDINLLAASGEELEDKAILTISGILSDTHTAWDNAAIVDLKLGWLGYEKSSPNKPVSIWGSQVLHYFWIWTNPSQYAGLSSLINERSIAQLAIWDKAQDQLEQILGRTQRLSTVVSALILMICFVLIAALMLMRFQGMTHQIATLRAIGFSNKRLMSWFAFEATYILIATLLASFIIERTFWQILQLADGQSSTIAPLLEWPVWLSGALAFASSLLIPWMIVLKKDLHENLRG